MTKAKQRNRIIAAAALVATGAAGTACQRSAGYQQDRDYYRGSEGPSYYDRSGGKSSPTSRLEKMGQPKKRVAIFDFWNDTPVKASELGTFAADELRRGLHVSRRVILPFDLKTDLKTQDFIEGDRVRMAQLMREGRRLGVAVLAIGRVTKVIFRQRGDDIGLLRQKQSLAGVDVEVKLFDVASGRELMAVGKSGEASSNSMVALEDGNIESPEYRAELTKLAVRSTMGLVIPDVIRAIEKLQWEGTVAKIVGTKIYVNAGRASGLVTGDILKVLTPGDDIYDPQSGAYLGRSVGRLKGTLEVNDFIGTDGAIAELHTGGNIQEGDLVQLY